MPTLEERVAAVESRVDAQTMSTTDLRGTLAEFQSDTGRRFAELQNQMNHRFEQVDRRFEGVDRRFVELQAQMNQRFDAVDQKIDRSFSLLVGIQVAVLIAVVGALVGPYYR